MKLRALVIAPHHDDESIGCGGLIAKLAEAGWDMAICVVFAPIEGINTPEHQKRLCEANSAASLLGAKRIGDLNFPCREFISIETITWQIVEVLRQTQPQLVLIPHETERDPEHISSYRACLEALWLSASGFRSELGPPLKGIDIVLGYEVWTPITHPQLTIDISGVIETKLRAIRSYASQLELTDYARAARGLAAYRGVMYGGCSFAESYSIIEAYENAFYLTSF
ncbi:MAG: PIG-L family deacetylase [Oscillatoria sp. SIO1A7]|nr:PIG-L family deacetylase [Oscillatoria sp. SIO1A7]